MSRWIGTITDTGSSLLDDSINGKGLSITKATFGTGTVDDGLLKQQTALVQEKQVAAITAKIKLSEGYKIGVETRANTEAYVANQIGMWGQVNGEGETYLVAIYQNKTGVQIPSSEEVADFLYTFYGVLAVKNDAKIEIQVDANFTVSREVLDAAVNDLRSDIAEDMKKKADLGDDGKIPESLLPEMDYDAKGSADKVKNELQKQIDGKQDALTFDDAPEDGSENPVKSGGVKKYVDDAVDDAKPPSHDIQLPASGWAEGKQTVSDPWLELDGFDYVIVAAPVSWTAYNEAGIRAEDMTVTGSMTFVCDEVPQTDLTAHVMKVATKEG